MGSSLAGGLQCGAGWLSAGRLPRSGFGRTGWFHAVKGFPRNSLTDRAEVQWSLRAEAVPVPEAAWSWLQVGLPVSP